MNNNGSHKRKFYDTLDILDSGYMSDRKSEAQKMFREIIATSVICTNQKENLKKDLDQFFANHFDRKNQYTYFKKEIISKYVINIPGIGYNLKNLENWIESETDYNSKQKGKLIKWMKNIFFVEALYDSKNGIGSEINDYVRSNIL